MAQTKINASQTTITAEDIGASSAFDTMPAAAVGYLDKIVQYVGATDATYTNGYFYKCVSDGLNPATYSWAQTNVQPVPTVPVTSVNTKTGAVVLTASDVGALPDNTHIPADPVQADWDEADSNALDYIKNKPTIPAAQVNSDWNAASGVAQILNKPTIPEAIQVSTMPTAGVDELGKVYQFIGTTDANYTHGYFYECVSDGQNPATYSWAQTNVQPAPSGLPSQTGNAGKFLTTDGTDASWASALTNTATSNSGITIGGISSVFSQSVNIGFNSNTRSYGVAVGYNAINKEANGGYSVAVGCNTETTDYSIAIGYGAKARSSIQLNIKSVGATNLDANTFKVANENGNYEMMSANGTIPTDRFTTTPVADGSYVPTVTISSGVATRSWTTPASAPVVPATMPTLAVADWSSNTQTVNVTGVTASNVVFVSPAPASAADYAAAGIVCTVQGSGTLTFTCTTVPTNAITVNVVILG